MMFLLELTASIEDNPLVMKLLSAFLILIGGFILGRVLGLLLRRILHGVNLDAHTRRVTHYRFSLERQLGLVLSVIVYAATIILFLEQLNATRIVLLIAITIVVAILVISFLLSLKDLLPNLFAGIILAYRKEVKPGVTVNIRGVRGEVERFSILNTTVKEGGDKLILPNRLFLKEEYTIKKKR